MQEQTTTPPPPHDDGLDDDAPVGRILSRREVLALFGLFGSAMLVSCVPASTPVGSATATPAQSAEAATAEAIAANPAAQATAANVAAAAAEAASLATVPSCVVRPEMTEGPYFVDEQLNRADIRIEPSDGSVKEGIPLTLTFAVAQIANNACTPLQGAQVDIWHCDAAGVYSGVSDRSFNTVGQKWLRGYLLTDASGLAAFTTIYPGWYAGRAVHIHFKIRTAGADGAAWEFTSQLFFDEATTAVVHTQPPYATKGTRDTPNTSDSIYRNGGDQMLLTPTLTNGAYSARIEIALDLSDADTGQSDSARGGRP